MKIGSLLTAMRSLLGLNKIKTGLDQMKKLQYSQILEHFNLQTFEDPHFHQRIQVRLVYHARGMPL